MHSCRKHPITEYFINKEEKSDRAGRTGIFCCLLGKSTWKYGDEDCNHLAYTTESPSLLRKQHGCFMALNQLETRAGKTKWMWGGGGHFAFPWQFEHTPGPLDKEATSCLWCRVRIFIMDFIPGQDERGKARRGNGTGHLHAGESRRDTFVSFPAVLYSHTHRQSECIRPARWQIGNQFTWIPSRSLLMHQKLVSLDVPQQPLPASWKHWNFPLLPLQRAKRQKKIRKRQRKRMRVKDKGGEKWRTIQ